MEWLTSYNRHNLARVTSANKKKKFKKNSYFINLKNHEKCVLKKKKTT